MRQSGTCHVEGLADRRRWGRHLETSRCTADNNLRSQCQVTREWLSLVDRPSSSCCVGDNLTYLGDGGWIAKGIGKCSDLPSNSLAAVCCVVCACERNAPYGLNNTMVKLQQKSISIIGDSLGSVIWMINIQRTRTRRCRPNARE